MAPTDGRVAKPERQRGCRCGTPKEGMEHPARLIQLTQRSYLQQMNFSVELLCSKQSPR